MRRPPLGTLGAVTLCVATALLTLLAPAGQARAPVPPEYQSLYRSVNRQLDAPFGVRPAARGKKPPVFGGHLLVADSNNGPKLLDPITLAGADITLERFKELGIKGVTVAIGYPLFTPSRNPDAARYIDFYKAIAAKVRARGMKFTVEQIVLYTNSNFSPWHFDLSGLTLAQLIAEQHQMAQTIIDELHPDYLTILHEPDTYAVLTGLSQIVDTRVAMDYVQGVLQGLDRGTTKVGAGSGTWSGPWVALALVRTDIDYLDVHVYWVNRSSVEAGKEMVAAAREHGKAVVIDEAWLYKSAFGGTEGIPGLGGNEAVYRRDVFSFFEPLDRKFLRQMTRFARSSGAEYFAPYWTNYFFAYLDYGPENKDLSYAELVLGLAPQAVANAILADRFTRTGLEYKRLIRRYGARTASRKTRRR